MKNPFMILPFIIIIAVIAFVIYLVVVQNKNTATKKTDKKSEAEVPTGAYSIIPNADVSGSNFSITGINYAI